MLDMWRPLLCLRGAHSGMKQAHGHVRPREGLPHPEEETERPELRGARPPGRALPGQQRAVLPLGLRDVLLRTNAAPKGAVWNLEVARGVWAARAPRESVKRRGMKASPFNIGSWLKCPSMRHATSGVLTLS
ncbi:unnamed protein product [Prorocentrum cordatum]|uniref:Uncharacterized protein n=1 Tax=Prorocentrum cordatum TaxID=2364126 RepID=A0ABN9QYD7_9DINO|nr:unnamed protein product [Polarella glacialis]